MTRPFKERGFTLARADHSTRVLVTAFLLCVIIGIGVAIAQYAGRAGGLGPRHAVEWIHGNETDFDATVLRVAKSRAELPPSRTIMSSLSRCSSSLCCTSCS